MPYQSDAVLQADDPMPGSMSLPGGGEAIYNHDGSVTISADGIQPIIPGPGDFSENLASRMSRGERMQLAARLIEYVEVDRESRKDWQDREAKALLMMGLRDYTEEESKLVPGRHKVVHPVLMEAAVHFQSNAIAELFPSAGPVKSAIVGKKTAEREAQADRVADFLNYYLTVQDAGYFNDTDSMLMYLPMSGSVFRKAGLNWRTGAPELRFVKAANFIANYSGRDLMTMRRYTHEYSMTRADIVQAMDLGLFADVQLAKVAGDVSSPDRMADIADSRVVSAHDDDEDFPLYEVHCDLALGTHVDEAGDGEDLRPYIVVVERTNEEVVCIRRNWREGDNKHEKRVWFAHHKFLPGPGFYGFGYPHAVGGLGAASSAALNAFLDSCFAANFQGGFKSKEARVAGSIELEHGVWKDVDMAAEELAKSFVTPPFREPSAAMPTVIGMLVNSAQRFAGTTDAAVGEGNNTGPVGTTVALIEQSKKPMLAIHKRLHMSFGHEFRMLADLVGEWLPDNYTYDVGGEAQGLRRQDFDARVDVISVSDPTISSNLQRIQRVQAVLQLVMSAPQLYGQEKMVEVHRRMLEAMHVEDIDAIAPSVEAPKYLDPVAENAEMINGRGVKAFPTQDDQKHLAVHHHGMMTVMSLPMAPQAQQQVLAAFDSHMRDHMASLYRKQIMAAAGLQPEYDEGGDAPALDPQVEAQLTSRIVSMLPPPPQPQQGEGKDEGKDDAQAKIERDDQLAAAKIRREDAEHAQRMRNRQEEFDMTQQLHKSAHEGGENRKTQSMYAGVGREHVSRLVGRGQDE